MTKKKTAVNPGVTAINKALKAHREKWGKQPERDTVGVHGESLGRDNNWHPFPSPDIRTFPTGAVRDTDAGKIDYEGFLSPFALEAYGEYMHRNRTMRDGSIRASDNWQKGFDAATYMKSAWRHFHSVWKKYRTDGTVPEEDLCALLFNIHGMLHETVKPKKETTP